MRYLIAALALAAASSVAAEDDATRFAARPAAQSVTLSPDGDKIPYIGAYKTGGYAVYVADLKSGDSQVMMAGAALELRPRWCHFKTETRLVCKVSGVSGFGAFNGGYSRIIAIDTDGKNAKMLSQRTGAKTDALFAGGSIANWLPDDPDHVLMQVEVGYTATVGSLIKAPTEGTGVATVDIRTGTQKFVEPSRNRVVVLGADDSGAVRFRGTANADTDGYVRDRVTYAVRAKGGKEWQTLASAAFSDARGVSFDGFDASGDHIYSLAPLSGRAALYAVATDGSGTSTLVYSRDDVDVDGVMRIGKYNRAVGATFDTERSEVHYFDAPLAKLSGALSKALPGHPQIIILDESWDGTKKLILADGDNAPGRYYLYDATAAKLGPLLAVYSGLDGVALGTVTPVHYAARDGTTIPGFLTLPPGKTSARGLPGLVMPHGGPSARDTAGFNWLAQFFAAQGFAVLQPNFRGSAGYGDAFFAKNGFKSWPLAIGDVNDGGRWLLTQGGRREEAGDLRLELWWVCGASGERRRPWPVPGGGRHRAGNRPADAADREPAHRQFQDHRRDGRRRPARLCRIARAPRERLCRPGADVPRRQGPERRDRTVARDGERVARRGQTGRTGRIQRSRSPARRRRRPARPAGKKRGVSQGRDELTRHASVSPPWKGTRSPTRSGTMVGARVSVTVAGLTARR